VQTEDDVWAGAPGAFTGGARHHKGIWQLIRAIKSKGFYFILSLALAVLVIILPAFGTLLSDFLTEDSASLGYHDLDGRYPAEYSRPPGRAFSVRGKADPADPPWRLPPGPPAFAPEPRRGGGWTLVAAGDLMAHEELQLTAYLHKDDPGETANGYDWIFRKVAGLVADADLAVGNLETLVSPSAPRSGFPRFNVDPSYLVALKNLGFDLLLLANNHMLDKGVSGLLETQNEITKSGLMHTGAQKRQNPEQEFEIVEVGKRKI
jgi:hypothetical protein